MQLELRGGHLDSEMRRIKQHADMSGVPFSLLTKEGKYCDSRNAYDADPVYVSRKITLGVVEGSAQLLSREQRKTNRHENNVIVFDHHKPEIHPGARMGPKHYWRASSLGQICNLLGHKPKEEDLIIAAADHCLPAAAQGKCPNVYGPDVIYHRINEIAIEFNLERSIVETRVRIFRGIMSSAKIKIFNQQEVLDLRKYRFVFKVGVYSSDLLILQVALAMEGKAALVCFLHEENTPEVIMVTGYVRQKTVYAFWDWAKRQGLVNLFGVPLRGYGGAQRPFILHKKRC